MNISRLYIECSICVDRVHVLLLRIRRARVNEAVGLQQGRVF